MKKCLIIDSYGFLFRAFHVQPPLTSPKGDPVGAIYGFTSMLIKLLSDHKPSHIVAVFDSGGKNFRHEIYPDYKAHRPDVDQDLIKQFPISRIVANKLGITSMEAKNYEADDVIATLAKQISEDGEEVIVVSSDKDLAQLMSDKIKIFDPVKAKYITDEIIQEKFGIDSTKIRDYLSLVGDKSDNIPGVPSFGPKTAAQLINQFGDLSGIIENRDKIESARKKQVFEENLDNARLSYELVGLKFDVPVQYNKENIEWIKPEESQVNDFLNEYGFKSLIQRAKKITKTMQMGFDILTNEIDDNSNSARSYNEVELEKVFHLSKENGYISISNENNEIYVSCLENIAKVESIDQLNEICNDNSIRKIIDNLKNYKDLSNINAYDDISIMSYILSAGTKQLDINGLFIKYLDENISDPKLYVLYFEKLSNILKKNIFKEKQNYIYDSIDLPLSKILKNMENIGVKFDSKILQDLSLEFEQKIKNLEIEIYKLAGKEFNIASPKQLSEILFDELNIPSGKKGKSGARSTGADILENLALEGYDIASKLLDWRHYSKLKNTYTDALPKLINENTGRIHTTLMQTSTATGRLSSHDPNLQNIPIRTEDGVRIRKSLVAESKHKLIAADYSQIELRLLAILGDIRELKDAFSKGEDIHTNTASQIFGISSDKVDREMRRKAKAINFGIIYGISAFGLAKQLKIPQKDAKEYIERYFEAFPGIKNYMERAKNNAYENGYVENYVDRKCYLPLIRSSNFNEKSFAQRAAINAPLQGSAADIAKIAMINVQKYLENENLKTKMILQIHDELLFEAPDEEVEFVVPKIKQIMEHVANFDVKLQVDVKISDSWS